MSDTAQLDASTAPSTSQSEASAPPSSVNNGIGAAPSIPTGSHAETGAAPASNSSPTNDAQASSPGADKAETPPPSLTNPKSVAPTAQNADPQRTAAVADPRVQHERAEANRWGHERQRMVAEIERMRQQTTELQQFREESMRKEQQAKAKRWDQGHPETRKFDDLLSRRERARGQMQRGRGITIPDGLPPDQQRALRTQIDDLIAGDFTDDEQRELADFDKFQQESIRGLTTNMPATIGKIVGPMIRQGVQQFMQEMNLQREVSRDMEDPELKPLLDRFDDDFQQALRSGVPYDQAVHYTKVYGQYEQALARIAQLEQQIGGMNGKVSAATVQQELAKGKASITRDVVAPKTNPFLEARKWARDNGVDTDSDAFRKKVREIEQRPG